MIDTIIFDLGGVLVDFHPYDGFRELGISEDAIEAFKNNIILGGVWETCDKYAYSDSEIRNLFKENMKGFETEVDRMWDNITVVTSVKPYTDKWLDELRSKGLKLYVLSNYGKCSFEANSKTYPFLSKMDGMLISYQIEEVKPEPQIYEYLLNKYNIDRKTAVFIDDRIENVNGAIAVGLNGLLFSDYETVNEKLNEMI